MSLLKAFESPRLDSRIESANVSGKEKVLGYLIGPGAAVVFNTVLGTYLNIYHTDVLGTSSRLGAWAGWGLFLVLLPIISKALDAVTNVLMGALIDRTHTRQGKLRPYILISTPLIVITGLMLFWIPNASQTVQIIWIILSYNLFFCVAYTIYNVPHQLMAAHSTRNPNQRMQISVFSRIPHMVFAGIIGTAIFPMVFYPMMQRDEKNWLIIMSVMSLLMLPLTLIEYFYTRERVTEEENQTAVQQETVPIMQQLKVLVKEPTWLCFILMMFLSNLSNTIGNSALTYYCNWVLAPDYNQGGALIGIVNLIGGMPGMLGAFLAIPVAKVLGREKTTKYGLLVSVFGCVISFIWSRSMLIVSIGKFLQTLGLTGITYLSMAILADVLDFCELKHGIRAAGLTGSMLSVFQTLCQGLSTGILNGTLAISGYKAPADLLQADGVTYGSQTEAVKTALTILAFGVCMVIFLLMFVLMSRIKLEDKAPETLNKLMTKKKAEVEAAGGTWVDPSEAARLEQEAIDKEREAETIARIQAKCAKKGLDFDAEYAKHLKHEADKPKRDKIKLVIMVIAMIAIVVVLMKVNHLI